MRGIVKQLFETAAATLYWVFNLRLRSLYTCERLFSIIQIPVIIIVLKPFFHITGKNDKTAGTTKFEKLIVRTNSWTGLEITLQY